ncbi:MAG: arsenate reductase (azurin) small subunit [Deltaproteobacteria bacterium]|nr:arsenate reductase (azurin) small subunit [Deltaproteobacteria bacterium]
MVNNEDKEKECLTNCLTTRRQFLFMSGAATATILLTQIPGLGLSNAFAVVAKYPRQKIGKLSALKQDMPVTFSYPSKDVKNILVKLGAPAGAGIGKGKDVVAFNPVCTHMGGNLEKAYHAEYKVLGQCPFHLSTFDLTRHGIIVSGHATESLPQIELELEGDDIYATGVIGLVYGRNSNI